MITIDSILSDDNKKEVLAFLKTKKDGAGIDGMRLSELEEYWKINEGTLEEEIREGTYEPGLIKSYEITNGKGKRRTIHILNSIDRFVTSLIAAELREAYEKKFKDHSYAYQRNKGITAAIEQAKSYIEVGNKIIVKIDIKNFFDCIPIEKLLDILSVDINDTAVLALIKKYLYCTCSVDGVLEHKIKGVLQGNPMSPILSNIYLDSLDEYMENKGYSWIRFGDDISIYVSDREVAGIIYKDITRYISNTLGLDINTNKSCICDVFNCRLLGYDFLNKNGNVIIKKHTYQKVRKYSDWTECSIEKVNKEYHILHDGIINKKDFSILFENEEEKHHIPIEVTDQINIYSNVSLTSNILKTLSNERIRVSYFDRYGNHIGDYIPEGYLGSGKTVLKQSEIYNDSEKRCSAAKNIEIASIHNMRANMRYYNKKIKDNIDEEIKSMSQAIVDINEAFSIEKMMLIEARARGIYYSTFNRIINQKEFEFTKRTRRPPKDELNAMISFGNTMLYNYFAQFVSKTSLDDRIGVVHATNNRAHSLSLDFADVFKPVIVDRLIFSLINKHQIKKEIHFCTSDKGGVYLNDVGKRLFVENFDKKLISKVVVKGEKTTYRYLMEHEVKEYAKFIERGKEYKAYKYY